MAGPNVQPDTTVPPEVEQFLLDFPEFSGVGLANLNDRIAFWLQVGSNSFTFSRWGKNATIGLELFAAHFLSKEIGDAENVEAGSAPGVARGAISAESVDKASVSYDITSVSEEGAGQWNSTEYGKRFWSLSRLFGAGPVQVGAGCWGGGAGGWPGVIL